MKMIPAGSRLEAVAASPEAAKEPGHPSRASSRTATSRGLFVTTAHGRLVAAAVLEELGRRGGCWTHGRAT